LCGNILNFDTEFMRHVADDSKDDKTSKETCQTITQPNYYGISEDIVLELVVTGQSDHPSPGDPQGEEYLDTCIRPDLEMLI